MNSRHTRCMPKLPRKKCRTKVLMDFGINFDVISVRF